MEGDTEAALAIRIYLDSDGLQFLSNLDPMISIDIPPDAPAFHFKDPTLLFGHRTGPRCPYQCVFYLTLVFLV